MPTPALPLKAIEERLSLFWRVRSLGTTFGKIGLRLANSALHLGVVKPELVTRY
jgi:hypothetical protein